MNPAENFIDEVPATSTTIPITKYAHEDIGNPFPDVIYLHPCMARYSESISHLQYQ